MVYPKTRTNQKKNSSTHKGVRELTQSDDMGRDRMQSGGQRDRQEEDRGQ